MSVHTIPAHQTEMPDDVRHAFLKILYYTLIDIRGHTKDAKLCYALSDHAHNIPDLIDRYTIESFRYYWEVERPCFIRSMEQIGRSPYPYFQEHWDVIEKHYQTLQYAG